MFKKGSNIHTQVWYHRQALVEMLNNPAGELDFVEEMLVEDSKNYHAWSYRQWYVSFSPSRHAHLKHMVHLAQVCVLTKGNNALLRVNKRFSQWEGELLFVDRLLREDLRNNSAWNHRHFVIRNTTGMRCLGNGIGMCSAPQPRFFCTNGRQHGDASAV